MIKNYCSLFTLSLPRTAAKMPNSKIKITMLIETCLSLRMSHAMTANTTAAMKRISIRKYSFFHLNFLLLSGSEHISNLDEIAQKEQRIITSTVVWSDSTKQTKPAAKQTTDHIIIVLFFIIRQGYRMS